MHRGTLYQNWLHRGKKLWHSIVPLLRKQTVTTSYLGVTLPRPHSNFTSSPIANTGTCSIKNWAFLKSANVLSISENFQWQNRTVFSRNISKSGEMYTNFFLDFLPEFPFHLIFVLKFPQFSTEWFAHTIFWKLFQEMSLLSAPILKFPEVLVEWRAPLQYTRLATF